MAVGAWVCTRKTAISNGETADKIKQETTGLTFPFIASLVTSFVYCLLTLEAMGRALAPNHTLLSR